MKRPTLLDRLRIKKSTLSVSMGVGWYTEENWTQIRATAADPEKLEATYSEWVAMAMDALVDLRRAGGNPVKHYIDASVFLTWCKLNGTQNDAKSRARFVAEHMRSGRKEKSDA